jgi:hypothetical protein
MNNREQLHQQGFALLRRAIPAEWLDDLRQAFDAGVLPSDRWPVPRGQDWRHSLPCPEHRPLTSMMRRDPSSSRAVRATFWCSMSTCCMPAAGIFRARADARC